MGEGSYVIKTDFISSNFHSNFHNDLIILRALTSNFLINAPYRTASKNQFNQHQFHRIIFLFLFISSFAIICRLLIENEK